MKKSVLTAVVVAALGMSALAPVAFAGATKMGGGSAMITIADVMQSNGVIHVVDTVLMP